MILDKLKAIGVVPGEKFDPAKLDPAFAKGLEKSLSVAMEKLQAASKETGAPVNGWRGPAHGAGQLWQQLRGASGGRAGGPGANLPQDAVYPSAFQDVLGCPEKW